MKKAWTGLAIVVASIAVRGAAFAQSDPATIAKAHIAHIAAADAASLRTDYAADSTLWWVGGPLDGTYGDASAIRGVWMKFATAQGALTSSITALTVAANPQGQTVVADVVYTGAKGPLKVRQIILMRQEHIVDEIWQIAPAGVVTP